MPQLRQFPDGTDDIGLAEKVPRISPYFTTGNMFMRLGVSGNTNTVYGCLFTLINPHFQIDRILGNINLYRVNLEEKVSIIQINVRNCIFVR